ncbi:MAG: response regulator transcription factor [Clostridia bacterium]|nr:response regulator transcription factor [Clostridia bacterium]
MTYKILLIEDDNNISTFITTILDANGYEPLLARNGKEAMALVSSSCPDLVLLDMGLPDMDGMKILQFIRQWSSLPVIVVSARTRERDKVEALDAGADDYITKPFGSSELLARIRTALRHANPSNHDSGPYSSTFVCGDFSIDYDKHRVKVGEKEIHLTQSEYKMVSLLCQNAGKVLTYDFISKQIWGPYNCEDNQKLRVNMANIRRKIEPNPAVPEYIFTEVGVGYRMRDY